MSSVSDPTGSPSGHARVAQTLSAELRYTSRMGFPLMLGEMGWMSTYLVDALMVGRLPHSALSISASSLGNTIFYAIAFSGIALLTGMQTLAAQAFGRGDERGGAQAFVQSLWLVAIMTPLVMIATLVSLPMLSVFKTPPDIIAETRRYLYPLVWSTFPLMAYWCLRKYLQSVDRVLLITLSLISSGVVNFIADWAFLYGHLGLPKFGIAGSAWATLVVRIYALGLLLIALRRYWRKNSIALSRSQLVPTWQRFRPLLRIGWPPALKEFTDLGVSTYMSILCAQLGATLLAAHQVVLDLAAFAYMAPLGLSYATAARVGQGVGRKSIVQARRSARASLLLALGVIALAASLFVGLPRFWAGFYTNDSAVVSAAAPLFFMCAILLFGDATGVIIEAALIGVGDTRSPLIVGSLWSWVLGMPLSYWLTFHQGLSLRGLWIGRVVAAVGSSITLALVWQMRLRGMNLSSPSSGRGTYSLSLEPTLAEPS